MIFRGFFCKNFFTSVVTLSENAYSIPFARAKEKLETPDIKEITKTKILNIFIVFVIVFSARYFTKD